jgi:hypothetical protein
MKEAHIMRRTTAVPPIIVAALLLPLLPTLRLTAQHGPGFPATLTTQSVEKLLPLAFEVNRGQVGPTVRYLAHGSGYTVFLTETGPVIGLQTAQSQAQHVDPFSISPPPLQPAALEMLRLSFLGAGRLRLAGQGRLPGIVNYFLGRDPRRWQTDIPTYSRVVYRDVYPAVDLAYYGTAGRLEYDIIARPGARLGSVELRFIGARELWLDRQGNLHIVGSMGSLVQDRPLIYQRINGRQHRIPGRYVLVGRHRIAFRLSAYDRGVPLVIDPVVHLPLGGGRPVVWAPTLSFATYVGGSSLDDGLGLAVDASGDSYLVGQTGSADFAMPGALQRRYGGAGDAFVTKLNPSGTARLYTTYLGGSSYELGSAIAVDAAGNAYVTGITSSPDFPLRRPLQQSWGGGYDAFVAELNPAGDRLDYSTYLGGRANEGGFGIAVGATGAAYVVGSTRSSDFPVRHAVQPTNRALDGTANAFVACISPGGTDLLYSTYWGGRGGADGNGITVDSTGNAYVVGATLATSDFPLKNALQTTYGGGVDDATVAKFDAAGHLVYSTLLGGHDADRGQAIAVDSTGNAYVAIQTSSPHLPHGAGIQPTYGGGRADGYIARLSADGRALLYGTYLGGHGIDTPMALAVDSVGNAYDVGITRSPDFPLVHPLPGHSRLRGGVGAYLSILNPAGSALTFSTYLGGSKDDFGTGVGLDAHGNIYISGQTDSTDLATMGAAQVIPGGGYDAFVARISPVY